MPILIEQTVWNNPWDGGDVLVAASVSNVAGTLNPTPPAAGWQVGYRPATVDFYIHVPTASAAYFATIYIDDGIGPLGHAINRPLTSAGTTRISVALTFTSADISGAQLVISDGGGAVVDGVAYLHGIEFPINLFWTSLDGCVESAG
jgi:hypothetical protein